MCRRVAEPKELSLRSSWQKQKQKQREREREINLPGLMGKQKILLFRFPPFQQREAVCYFPKTVSQNWNELKIGW